MTRISRCITNWLANCVQKYLIIEILFVSILITHSLLCLQKHLFFHALARSFFSSLQHILRLNQFYSHRPGPRPFFLKFSRWDQQLRVREWLACWCSSRTHLLTHPLTHPLTQDHRVSCASVTKTSSRRFQCTKIKESNGVSAFTFLCSVFGHFWNYYMLLLHLN